MAARHKVLFLCTGNSCRSQMAEGLLRSLAGDRHAAHSAGTVPKGVNPDAVAAMSEIGIDISGHRSEHVDSYLGSGIETVISVCDRAAASCPAFPEAVRRIHWSFADPDAVTGSRAERKAAFRQARDEIAGALRDWLAGGSQAPA